MPQIDDLNSIYFHNHDLNSSQTLIITPTCTSYQVNLYPPTGDNS
jgi:hypothetical protein